jgi:hypothetical protein
MLYGMAAMPLVNPSLTDINKEHAQTEPGMAHFAGTGPAGATCGKCGFWGYKKPTSRDRMVSHNGCYKYYELMKKDGPAIKASLPACKYYEETAAPVAPPLVQPYRDSADEPAPHSSDYHD